MTYAALTHFFVSLYTDGTVRKLILNIFSPSASFDPHMKGLAISNQDVIREVHNSFARQSSFDFIHDDKDPKDDAFHFIG